MKLQIHVADLEMKQVHIYFISHKLNKKKCDCTGKETVGIKKEERIYINFHLLTFIKMTD